MPEQHPIPQQISSYQFRLVGDMTLKQFFQLASGAVVSLIFYASNLHPVIKWPGVIFFALLGVAIAFLPVEERSLDQWFLSFIKAIYSPTLYYWKRSTTPTRYFSENAQEPNIIMPQGKISAEKYLEEVPRDKSPHFEKLESAEEKYLTNVAQQLKTAPKIVGPTTLPKPVTLAVTPGSGPTPASKPPQKKNETASQMPGSINIPKMAPVAVEASQAPSGKVRLAQDKLDINPNVVPVYKQKPMQKGESAVFSPDVTPPTTPERPNIIVGQVFDENKKIIESAILEIRDEMGRPARALRTNKLGHFLIVTPLTAGNYQITIEKEGFEFKPIQIEAAGKIIQPIAITGTVTKKGSEDITGIDKP